MNRNHPIIDSIMGEDHAAALNRQAQEAAERQKALGIYYGILADARRVTPKDKETLRACMKTLGKSLEEVKEDASTIRIAREHFEEACNIFDAEEARDKASDDLKQYLDVEVPRLQQQIADEKARLEGIRQEASNRCTSADGSLGRVAKMAKAYPWVVRFLPSMESGEFPENLYQHLRALREESDKGRKPAA